MSNELKSATETEIKLKGKKCLNYLKSPLEEQALWAKIKVILAHNSSWILDKKENQLYNTECFDEQLPFIRLNVLTKEEEEEEGAGRRLKAKLEINTTRSSKEGTRKDWQLRWRGIEPGTLTRIIANQDYPKENPLCTRKCALSCTTVFSEIAWTKKLQINLTIVSLLKTKHKNKNLQKEQNWQQKLN